MARIVTIPQLSAGYLFRSSVRGRLQKENPAKSTAASATPPSADAAVIAGLKEGVERLAVETCNGYGDEQTWSCAGRFPATTHRLGRRSRRDHRDGAKPDAGNIQSIFSDNSIIAFQDPAYPVYVDSNVIAGRSGPYDPRQGLYNGFIYMRCSEENGFIPAPPSEKVDLIYLCSPNNPTGAVANRRQLRAFVTMPASTGRCSSDAA